MRSSGVRTLLAVAFVAADTLAAESPDCLRPAVGFAVAGPS